MKELTKKLGVIVSVNGDVSEVAMYHLSNDTELIWDGDVLTGPKLGAFLTIHQNNVKIITTVETEKVIDQQNSIKSTEFDNRYSKDSINRLITLKVKGVIENNEFHVTSKYVPMIGNEITYTTAQELNIIFGIDNHEDTIVIGKSLLEGQDIKLSIDRFFASHIGIFGNTGSGKSNTLHKLYLELFRTKYRNKIFEKSQFFVIDFNGEYTGENMFSLDEKYKKNFLINTRSEKDSDKLPIKKEYIFDPDILSILFDARPATQVPFLRNALRDYKTKVQYSPEKFAEIEIGLLISLLRDYKKVGEQALNNWISAAESLEIEEDILSPLKEMVNYIDYGKPEIVYNSQKIFEKNDFSEYGRKLLRLDELEEQLQEKFQQANEIRRLYHFLEFQKVFVSSWKSTNIEHINPLFHRIRSALDSLEKVVELSEDISGQYKPINVISLVNANQEIKRLIPMLLSKMIYDEHKEEMAGKAIVDKTKHLIIDEAHNILNAQRSNIQDDWQDYRLSIFEEIIKEGRKFGFFLTLASQRPADISPTIMSQIHNYIIHRLVNDLDLQMLENTMPTLDKYSFNIIPSLGKGEVIITGVAIQIPAFVKVPKEHHIRPKSDDIILTNIWELNNDKY